jgi:hypothetical protein
MKGVVAHSITLLDVVGFGPSRSESCPVGILYRRVQGLRRRDGVLAHNVIRFGLTGKSSARAQDGVHLAANCTADLLLSDAGVEIPDSRTDSVRAPARRSHRVPESSFFQTRFCRRNL